MAQLVDEGMGVWLRADRGKTYSRPERIAPSAPSTTSTSSREESEFWLSARAPSSGDAPASGGKSGDVTLAGTSDSSEIHHGG